MEPGSTKSDDREVAPPALADGFVQPTEADWLELVDKVLKGSPLAKLDSVTPGGMTVHPLYTADSTPVADTGRPGEYPFVRGSRSVAARKGADQPAWAIRTEIRDVSPKVATERVLEALERGSTGITLVVAGSGGAAGIEITGSEDLDSALEGVLLDLASVHLRAGERFVEMAGWLTDLWERRGTSPADARGGFGADPIGTLAATGRLGVGIDAALEELGRLAARTASVHPGVRAISVDSSVFADAGADEVDELAIVLSIGAAYLRACSAAGMDVDEACRQIEITTTTDADIFTGVAKLRVLRRLWSIVATSCGAAPDAIAPRVNVRTAATMMTNRDPWVNLLRVTAASMAAALGGADSIVTLPYDHRLHEHGELGRRLARNTQLLLAEESNLARVIDPMGGSWYLESLTDELASAAWGRFGELEAAGGMPEVLVDGTIAASIVEGVTGRMTRVATRRQPMTGISEFPDLAERSSSMTVNASTADDAGSPDRSDPVTGTVIAPLVPVHWSSPFEELRDRSDAHLETTGARPRVFLVNIGPVAKHTARATFAQNFYAAGGVEAITSVTGSETGFGSAAGVVADVKAMEPDLVCICSADDVYEQHAVEFARSLSGAGVGPIHLAGKPGELEQRLRDAGVEEFVHVGVDVIQILTAVHETVGTPEVNH